MTNPKNRGTAPGRAQPKYLRPGSFKSGHKKLGGRKRGTPNAFSADYKNGILEAAYRIGNDGNGKNGIVGYFQWVARCHAPSFMLMLGAFLPWEYLQGDAAEGPCPTIDEINEEIRDCTGLANKPKPKSPWAWTGQDFPVGPLMECAVGDPNGFCKLMIAAFIRPPTAKERRCAWEQSQTARDRTRY